MTQQILQAIHLLQRITLQKFNTGLRAVNITQNEAVERETIWKKKLFSREYGYNNN